MGTALASFVAGLLIVFTQFDETQVTKVDDLQGSIKEIRSDVKEWESYQNLYSKNGELLEKVKLQSTEALEESKEFLSYLKKESLKVPEEESNQSVISTQNQKKDLLLDKLSKTRVTISELDQLQLRLAKFDGQTETSEIKIIVEEAIHLTMQTGIEKARMSSFELLSHLEEESLGNKNSEEHYETLIQNISGVNSRLIEIN